LNEALRLAGISYNPTSAMRDCNFERVVEFAPELCCRETLLDLTCRLQLQLHLPRRACRSFSLAESEVHCLKKRKNALVTGGRYYLPYLEWIDGLAACCKAAVSLNREGMRGALTDGFVLVVLSLLVAASLLPPLPPIFPIQALARLVAGSRETEHVRSPVSHARGGPTWKE